MNKFDTDNNAILMAIITMNAAFKKIQPTHLQRDILRLTAELEKLSLAKKNPPAKPPVNTWWNKNP